MLIDAIDVLAVALIALIILAEWKLYYFTQQAHIRTGSGESTHWTFGRATTLVLLIALGLLSFPLAIYYLAVSWSVPPWELFWPGAAILTINGFVAFVLGVGLTVRKSRRATAMVFGAILLIGLFALLRVWEERDFQVRLARHRAPQTNTSRP